MEFLAQLIWTPDHDSKDIDQEIENMFLRVQFMQAWLASEIDTDVFFDFMAEQNTDIDNMISGWYQDTNIII